MLNQNEKIELLNKYWNELTKSIGAKCNINEEFEKIITAYSEPHRYYHTLNHLVFCFDRYKRVLFGDNTNGVFNSYLFEFEHNIIKLAIFFHDIVYDTKRDDNELKSWEKCLDCLYELGCIVDDFFIEELKETILASDHKDRAGLSYSARVFLDIDLSILGTNPTDFDKYENDIRKEYEWVWYDVYKEKRVEVLNKILSKKNIYYNSMARNKWEGHARNNIKRSITSLMV